MMFNGVMFGGIVSKVGVAWAPVNIELSLFYSVHNPVEAHVHGFRHFLLDGLIGYANSCGVIYLDRRGRLWPVHFY